MGNWDSEYVLKALAFTFILGKHFNNSALFFVKFHASVLRYSFQSSNKGLKLGQAVANCYQVICKHSYE